eukprot:2725104-Pleurochrysis_carterae.AAC.2
MAAVRAILLVCGSSLWMLLRAIGSNALPTRTFSSCCRRSGRLCSTTSRTSSYIIEGVHKEKLLTARARRAAPDNARIREFAAGSPIVERLLSAAFAALATSMRNHAASFLPGVCAEEQITDEMRTRTSGSPMTSTHAER